MTTTTTSSDRAKVALSLAIAACMLLVVWLADMSITAMKEARQLKRDAELLEIIGQARERTSEITLQAMKDHEYRMQQLRRETQLIEGMPMQPSSPP